MARVYIKPLPSSSLCPLLSRRIVPPGCQKRSPEIHYRHRVPENFLTGAKVPAASFFFLSLLHVRADLFDTRHDFYPQQNEQTELDRMSPPPRAPPAASPLCTSSGSTTPPRQPLRLDTPHLVIVFSSSGDRRSDEECHGRAASPPATSSSVTNAGEVRNPRSTAVGSGSDDPD